MFVARDWTDYELIDAGDGERLERWGRLVLPRPDPQIIWPADAASPLWNAAAARYHRSSSGGGRWEFRTQLPEGWTISYRELKFYIRPTNFKHTGLFPEQAANWNWMMEKIRGAGRPIRVLNLFAYTGGATVAAAAAGAEVCHVDAAKGMVQWAKENLHLSGLGDRPVRFITDDVFKFVRREQRRGSLYDGIVMDPPSYGRGTGGEVWKLEESLFPLVSLCAGLLSERPLFFLINSYSTGLSPTVLKNILQLTVAERYGGKLTCGEIGLPVTSRNLILPAGILCRWEE